MSPEDIWSDLLEGNRRFVNGAPGHRDVIQLRRDLAVTQRPRVVVLACSDSRVAPEIVFDQGLGDLFVIRTAGNIADAIAVGSIEYAIEHLGCSVLVLLGHERCGAVTAACSGEVNSPNLRAIIDRISPAVVSARRYAEPDALIEAAVRENVKLSSHDVLGMSAVLQAAVNERRLTIFGAIYQLRSGEVIRLD